MVFEAITCKKKHLLIVDFINSAGILAFSNYIQNIHDCTAVAKISRGLPDFLNVTKLLVYIATF